MKRTFKNKVDFRKTRMGVAAAVMSVVIAASACVPVHAASADGTIDGKTCTATLSVGTNATASTSSPLVAYHHVKVTFDFYYTDANGESQRKTSTAENNNSASVWATAYSEGTDVRKVSAGSDHEVKYGSYTWNKNLYE